MLKTLKNISTSLIHENPWWQYKRDEYVRPDESNGEYFYVHTHGSAFVILVLPNGDIVMVRQYRYLNQRESLEFPGGGIARGDSPLESAQRELQEETGFTGGTWQKLGEFNPFNGVTDEICHVFSATSLLGGIAQPETSEEFEVVCISPANLHSAIVQGEIWDGMTLAAWQLYSATRKQQEDITS